MVHSGVQRIFGTMKISPHLHLATLFVSLFSKALCRIRFNVILLVLIKGKGSGHSHRYEVHPLYMQISYL